ncbi:MAG: CRISPR-associated protein Cas2 [Candidatus Methanohalarchaeum thermophilum]|uniref:CRISPR-associated endoribonuclease Cas2 n=1 Tax=Methanohalarchaeum thermophilum TaxID=1903181 RepID=A0A1Q6DWL8_METT1|nr:MAG: CRISPR-associated protein Cas2 [Candidatus Methanohalarchaeum thermophilum]
MYFIIVYDVGVKRVNKVKKFLRKYLNWIQNSVFEGNLTKSELKEVKQGIKKIINQSHDSIIIYKLRNKKALEKTTIGQEKEKTDNII